MTRLLQRLLVRFGHLAETDRIIRVKRWWPSLGPWPEIGWPTYLMETRGGTRWTATPIWFPRS